MKTKFILIAAVVVLAGLSSCNRFLDSQPHDTIGEAQALTSKAGIQRALTGTYSIIQQQEYYGFEWMNAVWLGEDNVTVFGAGTTDLQFDGHAILASSNTIDIIWKTMYQAINNANNVIDGVGALNDPGFTAAERDNIMGQALFIRALVYFDLARTFGGVPLTLTPTRGLNANSYMAKSTLAEVYEQAGKDLDAAEAKLPVAGERNLATKRAATALKARLNLYLGKWEAAEQNAALVIGDAAYSLVKPFDDLINKKNTSEAIFELSYNTADGNPLGTVFLPVSSGGGYRIGPTTGLMAILNDPTKGGSRRALVAEKTDKGGNTVPYCNKYRTFLASGNSNDDVIVLRLAEMYLIRAEARARRNNLEGAIADINIVRGRADAPALTALGVSPEQALLFVEDERRMEFAFEPHRWFDLIRTNRASAVLGVSDARKFLFPLPASDVFANTNLQQNPGY